MISKKLCGSPDCRFLVLGIVFVVSVGAGHACFALLLNCCVSLRFFHSLPWRSHQIIDIRLAL
jgi:hypothetical protein